MSPENSLPALENVPSPEELALQKIQLLAWYVEQKGRFDRPTPDTRIFIYPNEGTINIGLFEAIEYRLEPKPGQFFNGSLMCKFHPTDLSASSIITEVREDEDGQEDVEIHYRYNQNRTTPSNSPVVYKRVLTEKGQAVLDTIPTFEQMPEQIDFPAAVIKICEIAIDIIQKGRSTPTDILALKDVLYGQATTQPTK